MNTNTTDIELIIDKQAISDLLDTIEFSLNYNYKRQQGMHPTRACLLYGTPKCGKKSLVHYVAEAKNLPIFKWELQAQECEQQVRYAFDRARAQKPSILLLTLDDILTIDETSQDRVINQLMTEIDGTSDNIFIFATSCSPCSHYHRLFRPSRLDSSLMISLPTPCSILKVLNKEFAECKFEKDANLEIIAYELNGYSVFDLKRVCFEAISLSNKDSNNDVVISDSSIKTAINNVPASATAEDRDNVIKALLALERSLPCDFGFSETKADRDKSSSKRYYDDYDDNDDLYS